MMQGPPKHQVCAFLLKSKDSIYHLRSSFRACFQCNNEQRLSGISLPLYHSTFVLVLRPSSFVLRCLAHPDVTVQFSPLLSTIRLRNTRSTTITDWNPKYILKSSRVGGEYIIQSV